MFSFVGETVLDPFAGSGTTSLAALHLGRNSIGYEINREFISVIREKLCGDDSVEHEHATIIFSEDNNRNYSFDSLPYIFHDPHKMDKKVDIKTLQFGSKIDSSTPKREDLHLVKEVISPEKILLDNGLVVCLLGVQEIPAYHEQAVEFLKSKFKNHKVFLKYDTIKYNDNDELMCYMYLDNKTFINNHLIRTGYVAVDERFDYSCKGKFLKSYPA